MKPILFVTGHAPAYRVGALACLHEREGIEVALFGGRSKHGGEELATQLLPFPHRRVRPRELLRLAGSGAYRAVVCPTGGRLAPLASWAGARRAGVPLIVWASLWAHPRSPAHVLSYLPLRHLYRTADAVVTYGPHVSAYVRGKGAAADRVFEASQAVDNEFWSAPVSGRPGDPGWPAGASVKFMFAGRPDRAKGLGALSEAWRESGLQASSAALVLVGVGSSPPWAPAGGAVVSAGASAATGIVCLAPASRERLREMYADADVLVVPSIRTRTFREPWGLVVNEAMNGGLAVIASDEVGAVAGGLVRDGRNGLVVRAGDRGALALALVRLARDGELRARLGAAGARDVRAYTYEAWAQGFSGALASVGLARTHC